MARLIRERQLRDVLAVTQQLWEPVKTTATQKCAAPGCWSVEGIPSRLRVEGVLDVVKAFSACADASRLEL